VLCRFKGLLGGRLLCRTAAAAGPVHADFQFRNRTLDLELLVMRGTPRLDDGINRQRDSLALQILLQQCLAVLAKCLWIDCLQHRLEQLADDGAGSIESAVQKDRAENSLHCVSQDRRATEAAAFHFSFAQPQKVGEDQSLGDIGERLLLDQVGTQPRQITFVQTRVLLEQDLRNGAVQYCIAEELEALVVNRAVAAMRDGLFEQRVLDEGVAEALDRKSTRLNSSHRL